MTNFQVLSEVVSDLWKYVCNGFSYQQSIEGKSQEITFKTGSEYLSNSTTTTKVRLLLTKQYSLVDIERSLQPSEFVAYTLMKDEKKVPTEAKHWLAGYWHQKLKGAAGVHISVVPTAGAVMEYFDDNQDGVVGVVTDISDDETITFNSVGLYKPGVYEEHFIPQAFWHELRPVFTSITKSTE